MNETKKDNMSQEQNHYPQSNGATSENQPMTALPQSQQSSDSSQIHDDTQPQISSENKPQPSDTSSFFKGLFIVKFTGRMRRRDFLLSLLLLLISEFLIGVVIGLAELPLSFVYETGFDEGGDVVILFFVILFFFGSYLSLVMLGMAVRRLHDAGKSEWPLLLCFLPYVGILADVILLAIMCCRDSQYGFNRWGVNPKGQGKSQAVNRFRLAAEQGDTMAQYNLGWCYANGYDVNRDFAEAMKWFRRAADNGDHAAMLELGKCFLNGTGAAKKDKEQVKQWLRKASDMGNTDAKELLQRLEHRHPTEWLG